MNREGTAVLILHFGDANLTNECLSSVQSAGLSDDLDRIFIIDNADSQDFTLNRDLMDRSVKILKSSKNLGYAGGMNLGIRQCLKKGYKFIFLLNNDTIITKGCITKLREFLQSRDMAGIVSPLILYNQNRQKIWSTGSAIYPSRGKTKDPLHNRSIVDLPKYKKVDAVPGCAIMVKAEVFENIGLFDESYFAYFEDIDLCHRAGLYGYEVYFLSGASVFHRVASASKNTKNIRMNSDFFMIRNRIYFMKKFARRLQLAAFYLVLPVEAAVYLAKNIVRLRLKKAVSFLAGLWEGLFPPPPVAEGLPEAEISACIITKDAEQTIERCLQSLASAVDEITILDSGSKDNTISLCQKYTDKVFSTEFNKDFSALRNQVARLAEKPWILALDADEVISEGLKQNIKQLVSSPPYRAYALKRINYYNQSAIHFGYAGFDSLVRLYQNQGSFFYGRVHERLISQGPVKKTRLKVFHKPAENNFTHKSFKTKWMTYAAIEAESKACSRKRNFLGPLSAPLIFCLTFLKEIILLLGFLDGAKGFKIAYFRALYAYHVLRAISAKTQS
ncbi:glycosyltransferase [Acidobacteriota bacterium]